MADSTGVEGVQSGLANTDALVEAAERFTRLNELQERQQQAGPATRDLFERPIAAARRVLDELCEQPEVATVLQTQLQDAKRDDEALAYLNSSGLADTTMLEARRAELIARRQAPILRLAALYFGEMTVHEFSLPDLSIAQGSQPAAEVDLAEVTEGEAFLARDVFTVARALEGMQLQIGDNGPQATIVQTREQDGEFNKAYLANRPLFGKDRSPVYVAAVRGRYMIFLAAGDPAVADSCVAIMGIRMGDAVYDKPTKVAYELGFKSEKQGSVRLRDDTLILDLQERQK